MGVEIEALQKEYTAKQIFDNFSKFSTYKAYNVDDKCLYVKVYGQLFEILVDFCYGNKPVIYLNGQSPYNKLLGYDINTGPLFNTTRQVKKHIKKEFKRHLKEHKQAVEWLEKVLKGNK